jgi:Protein of unknown function (DUF3667)
MKPSRITDASIPSCLNCGYGLPDDANLCPSCGQKRTTGRILLWDVLVEWFDNTFSIDARLFRTLLFLFNPGKLTNEYFVGRHIRYWTPLRLFLLTAALYLSYASSFVANKGNGLWQALTENYDEAAGTKYKAYKELDSLKIEVAKKFKNRTTALAAQDTLLQTWWQNASKRHLTWNDKNTNFVPDSLANRINDEEQEAEAEDSLKLQIKSAKATQKINNTLKLGNKIDTLLGNSLDSIELPRINNIGVTRFSKRDFYDYSPDILIERYKIQGWWNKMTTKQSIKMMKGGNGFGDSFVGRISWALLLLMPILALWLKLLYIRDRRYYVEHLIFSFHIHSFAFVVLTLAMFLTNYCKLKGSFSNAAAVMCFVYIGVALKNVYHQSWAKTLLKYFLLIIAYLVMSVLVLIFTLVINFYLF